MAFLVPVKHKRSSAGVVLTVLALGGNALLGPGERGTAAEHRANLATTFAAVAPLPRGRGRRHARERPAGRERAAAPGARRRGGTAAPALGRRRADAGRDRDARRGRARRPSSGRPVAVVVTHVVVDPGRPRLREPDEADRPALRRPPGPRARSATAGWTLREEPGRGWRRVVPSPKPLEVAGARRPSGRCSRPGQLVVAVGGGGIPVVRRDRRLRRHRRGHRQGPRLRAPGRRARRRAARHPHRRSRASTGTSARTAPSGEPIAELDPERDAALVDELPAGSMRPKVEAAFAFVTQTGGEALITSAEAVRNGERRDEDPPRPPVTAGLSQERAGERSDMTESMRARVLGPEDGNAGMLGSMGVRFMLSATRRAVGSRSSSIRCLRGHWPRRFTATAARTSAASSSRDASARFSATRSPTGSRAI